MQPLLPSAFDKGMSRLRLRTIIRLRWIAVLGQTITVTTVYWGFGFQLPIGLCLGVIALSAWLNVFLRLRYPVRERLKSTHASAMLAYDLLQLAALLYLTGGLQNPFAFLIVVPVTVSAATQPPLTTLALGVLAALCVSLLTVHYMPLPWIPGETLELPFLYIAGVWAALVSGGVFLGLYAWRIAKETRQMSDALAATELVLAHEQKLSALDGLAAAAAHELGTPLATISVVAKELLRDLPKDSPLREDARLLQSQSQRCREILATLAGGGGEPDQMFASVPISHLLEEVAEPHRAPGIAVEVEADAKKGAGRGRARAEPVVARNPGVMYGLGNLIENAADFAKSRVHVRAEWDGQRVAVAISDDGSGFSPAVLERLGEPYVTTRPAGAAGAAVPEEEHTGLGLGFFIAKTLLERSGARLELTNQEMAGGGAKVEVVWPREVLDSPPRKG